MSLRFDPKNDAEAKGVHFLGLMRPTGTFEPIVLASTTKHAHEVDYELCAPVPEGLYALLASSNR